MFVGGIFAGYLGDVYGRRNTLVGAMCLICLSSFLSAASPSPAWLTVFRLMGGLGVGGGAPISFTLNTEFFPKHIVAPGVAVIGIAWVFGAMYMAGAAWIMLGRDLEDKMIMDATWRAYLLVEAVSVLLFSAIPGFFIPESPRYDLKLGNYERASVSISRLTSVYASSRNLTPAKKQGKAGLAGREMGLR